MSLMSEAPADVDWRFGPSCSRWAIESIILLASRDRVHKFSWTTTATDRSRAPAIPDHENCTASPGRKTRVGLDNRGGARRAGKAWKRFIRQQIRTRLVDRNMCLGYVFLAMWRQTGPAVAIGFLPQLRRNHHSPHTR
jgi:hypothetical protein